MPTISVSEVKLAAAGRELELLSAVGGINRELLDGAHHPCPRCGGKDRFRLIDQSRGAVICNQCFRTKNGDFIAAIQWSRQIAFRQALDRIAEHLRLPMRSSPQSCVSLVLRDWDDKMAATWLQTSRGKAIDLSGLKSCHAILGRYQGRDVLALPIFDQECNVVGHSVQDLQGQLLPVRHGAPVKTKTLKPKGTKGWMGQVDRVVAATNVWKVEGVTDLLALASRDLPAGHAVISNANGSEENAAPWILTALSGKLVHVVHDADLPGERGATKWASELRRAGARVKRLRLPFEIAPSHGNDLRDFIAEGGNILELAESASDFQVDGYDAGNALNYEVGQNDLQSILSPSGRTDLANASRFVRQFGNELLFVPEWNRWLTWDGTRWHYDCLVGVFQRAKAYAESLWTVLRESVAIIDRDQFGPLQAFVKASNQRRKINDFVRLAESDSRVVCSVDLLNVNPLHLNCPNGTVDLATGELRPHSPSDRITQVTRVEFRADAPCPRWIETLGLVFGGDAGLIRYVQQLLGYSISGDAGEAILPIAFGRGFNGKSTVWNPIAELLGDYATMASESLLLGNADNHPTEKAELYQRRFVAISEPERGVHLKEARVKELTGDLFVTARRMHENFWTFRRTHTFWLSTNHLPRIKGVDEGIWRRVKLIPFTVDLRTKVKPIHGFSELLVASEGPGILAWLVRGFLDWQQNGFVEPTRVVAATQEYRSDSDMLAEFIDEYCQVDDNAECLASDLFLAYQRNYQGKLNKTLFGLAMTERFQKHKAKCGPNRDKVVYQGLQLRQERA